MDDNIGKYVLIGSERYLTIALADNPNVNLNAVDRCGYTLLGLAAKNGHLGCLKILLEKGADPNFKSNKGRSPLGCALPIGNPFPRSKCNILKCFEELLRHGADPNVKYGSVNIIHVLANDKDLDFLLKLLEYDANIDAQTDPISSGLSAGKGGGNTPLHRAALDGQAKCCKILLDKGANATIKNNNGDTPEDIASDENIKKIFQDYANFPHSKQCLEY